MLPALNVQIGSRFRKHRGIEYDSKICHQDLIARLFSSIIFRLQRLVNGHKFMSVWHLLPHGLLKISLVSYDFSNHKKLCIWDTWPANLEIDRNNIWSSPNTHTLILVNMWKVGQKDEAQSLLGFVESWWVKDCLCVGG